MDSFANERVQKARRARFQRHLQTGELTIVEAAACGTQPTVRPTYRDEISLRLIDAIVVETNDRRVEKLQFTRMNAQIGRADARSMNLDGQIDVRALRGERDRRREFDGRNYAAHLHRRSIEAKNKCLQASESASERLFTPAVSTTLT